MSTRSPVPFYWGGVAGHGAAFFFVLGTIMRLVLNYQSPVHAANPFHDTMAMANLEKYPGYEGPLEVTGYVTLAQNEENHVGLFGRMHGLESEATGGVHVHEGKTCAGSGDHFYDNSGNAADPWADITYSASRHGSATVEANVPGFSLDKKASPPLLVVVKHALVVHGASGDRIACGVISDARTPTDTFRSMQKLDANLLRQLWDWRAANANLEVAKDFIAAIAFFLLASCVRALAEAFHMHRSGHKASVLLFVPCFTFAAIIAIIELTFRAGSTTMAAWIATRWSLEDADLRAFELSYFLLQSRGVWFFALEWWFLCVGMLTAAYLNARSRLMPLGWTVISVLVALTSVLGFTAEVGRFVNWRVFNRINTAAVILVTLLLVPIWLVWAGRRLQGLSGNEFEPISVGGDGQGQESARGEAEQAEPSQLTGREHHRPEDAPKADAERALEMGAVHV